MCVGLCMTIAKKSPEPKDIKQTMKFSKSANALPFMHCLALGGDVCKALCFVLVQIYVTFLLLYRKGFHGEALTKPDILYNSKSLPAILKFIS